MLREGSWVSRNTAVHPDELASRDVIIRVSDPFQSARAETDDNVLWDICRMHPKLSAQECYEKKKRKGKQTWLSLSGNVNKRLPW